MEATGQGSYHRQPKEPARPKAALPSHHKRKVAESLAQKKTQARLGCPLVVIRG